MNLTELKNRFYSRWCDFIGLCIWVKGFGFFDSFVLESSFVRVGSEARL